MRKKATLAELLADGRGQDEEIAAFYDDIKSRLAAVAAEIALLPQDTTETKENDGS